MTARQLKLDPRLISQFVKLTWGKSHTQKKVLSDLFQKDIGNTEIVYNLTGLLEHNSSVIANLCSTLGLDNLKVGGLLALIGGTTTLNNLSNEFLSQLCKICGIVSPEKLKIFIHLSSGDTKAIMELNHMTGNKFTSHQIE